MVVHVACLNCVRAALLCSLRLMDNLNFPQGKQTTKDNELFLTKKKSVHD